MAVAQFHRHFRLFLAVLVTACGSAIAAPAMPEAVPELLVVARPNAVHDRMVAALRIELVEQGHPVEIARQPPQELAAWLAAAERRPRLLVTLGPDAARAAQHVAPSLPVIHASLPEHQYRALAAATANAAAPGHTALFLDQPPHRQLLALRLALPQLRRIGVLDGGGSDGAIPALRAAAAALDLELVVKEVAEPRFLLTRLERLLYETDGLLITPDAALYNRYSLPKVLLAAYRQRKPVVGLSRAYVEAGALLAVHTTPELTGYDLADLVAAALATGALPEPRYPRRFAVTINHQVARSLGLDTALPSAEELERALLLQEVEK